GSKRRRSPAHSRPKLRRSGIVVGISRRETRPTPATNGTKPRRRKPATRKPRPMAAARTPRRVVLDAGYRSEVAESMLYALEGAVAIFEKHRELVLNQLKRAPIRHRFA